MKLKKLCTMLLVAFMAFGSISVEASDVSTVEKITISSTYVETGEPFVIVLETNEVLDEDEFLSISLQNLTSNELLYNYMTLEKDGIHSYAGISTKLLESGRYKVIRVDVVDKNGDVLRKLDVSQSLLNNNQFDVVSDIYEDVNEIVTLYVGNNGVLNLGETVEMTGSLESKAKDTYKVMVSFKNIKDKNEKFDVLLVSKDGSKDLKVDDDYTLPNVTAGNYDMYEVRQYKVVDHDGKKIDVLIETYDKDDLGQFQVTVEGKINPIDKASTELIFVDKEPQYKFSDIDVYSDKFEIKVPLYKNVSTVTIPYTYFSSIVEENGLFNFDIIANDFTYSLPASVINSTNDINKMLNRNVNSHIDIRNTSLRVTINDYSNNEEYKEYFTTYFDRSYLVSGIYDVKLELMYDGNIVGIIKNFDDAITKSIKFNENSTEYTGVFMLDDSELKFVPHKANGDENKYYINNLENGTFGVVVNNVTFSDVPTGVWYEEALKTSSSKDLVRGMGNNKFSPTGLITRAEFVTMIVNGLELPVTDVDTIAIEKYKDVATNQWYYENIMIAKHYGLLDEMGEENFKPMAFITREEMANIIGNVLVTRNIPVTLQYIDLDDIFTDADEMNYIYRDEIELAYRTHILRGNGQGQFNPKDNLSRAEAVQVQVNLLKLLGII